MPLNVTDILILIVLLIGVISGLARGFVRCLFGLAALVLGVMVAASVYHPLAEGPLSFVPGEHGSEIVAFVLLFLVVLIVVGVLGMLVSKAIKLASLGWLDRLAGGVLGFIMASIVAGVVVLLAVLAGLEDHRAMAGSSLAPATLSITDVIVGVVPADAREAFERDYERLRRRWDLAQSRYRAEAAREKDSEEPDESPDDRRPAEEI